MRVGRRRSAHRSHAGTGRRSAHVGPAVEFSTARRETTESQHEARSACAVAAARGQAAGCCSRSWGLSCEGRTEREAVLKGADQAEAEDRADGRAAGLAGVRHRLPEKGSSWEVKVGSGRAGRWAERLARGRSEVFSWPAAAPARASSPWSASSPRPSPAHQLARPDHNSLPRPSLRPSPPSTLQLSPLPTPCPTPSNRSARAHSG